MSGTGKRGPKKTDVVVETMIEMLKRHGYLSEKKAKEALGLKDEHSEEFDTLYLEMEAKHDAKAKAAAAEEKAAKVDAKAGGAAEKGKGKIDKSELKELITGILAEMAAGK